MARKKHGASPERAKTDESLREERDNTDDAIRGDRKSAERVAEQVNALPEVAHNYRREHAFNMWFVLATETPADIAAAIDRIERATGLKVYAFPKLKEYFVEMKLAA